MTDAQKQQLLDQLASSIRVHCAALATRVEVSDSWVMQLARNQVAAASDLIEEFETEAISSVTACFGGGLE